MTAIITMMYGAFKMYINSSNKHHHQSTASITTRVQQVSLYHHQSTASITTRVQQVSPPEYSKYHCITTASITTFRRHHTLSKSLSECLYFFLSATISSCLPSPFPRPVFLSFCLPTSRPVYPHLVLSTYTSSCWPAWPSSLPVCSWQLTYCTVQCTILAAFLFPSVSCLHMFRLAY